MTNARHFLLFILCQFVLWISNAQFEVDWVTSLEKPPDGVSTVSSLQLLEDSDGNIYQIGRSTRSIYKGEEEL